MRISRDRIDWSVQGEPNVHRERFWSAFGKRGRWVFRLSVATDRPADRDRRERRGEG